MSHDNPDPNPFGPGYLVAEIEELKRIAEQARLATLAYLLEVAAIEARHQVLVQQEAASGGNSASASSSRLPRPD